MVVVPEIVTRLLRDEKKKKKKTTSEKTLIYSAPLAFTLPAPLTRANQTIQHWQGC